MPSFTNAPSYSFLLRTSSTDMSPHMFPSVRFDSNSRKKQQRLLPLHFVAVRESGPLLGFLDFRNRNFRDFFWSCGGFVRRCKKDWESEGNFALEAEILEFMKNSENPEAFPSKQQLIDGGRMDLVEAILKQGGWLASGWELDDNADNEVGLRNSYNIDLNLGKVREWKNAVIEEPVLKSDVEWIPEVSNFQVDSHSSASSSGRSLETSVEEDSSIEGILGRLEKERNINFGFGLKERGELIHAQRNDFRHILLTKSSKNATVVDLERYSRPASSDPINGTINDSDGKPLSNIDDLRHSLRPVAWRMWSAERAGFSEMNFEADETYSYETVTSGEKDAVGYEIHGTREVSSLSLNRRKETTSHEKINGIAIRSRLQHLESELSSILNLLKSNTYENVSNKDYQSSSEELLMLSDAWEFQENEILNAQHKLRSIRAKLAVLEGKMALAIIDAQKIMEEKQKRADDARRALQLLRIACIVWPNPALEVFLSGSFDGWATKRKMQKSSTGIFSLCMKLYPGRYEIKFIVDGEWKVNPLRPVVQNNGYENNLLIIS